MIGFVGLSHLGLNYSLATAAKGFDVIAYDPDSGLVGKCQTGNFPIEEPGFADLFAANRDRITYTADRKALAECSLVFFALDVRTDERNESDTAPLQELMKETLPALAPGTDVVLLSQVSPGFTRALQASARNNSSIRIRSLYYQVETLIFGAAVQRAMEPERFIVGASDPAATLPESFRKWHEAFGCPVLVMRYESAELAKIAINFFLVSSVTTTNTLAEVCEAIGADWDEIAPALRLDRRIGPHAYLKPGLGIAGGNLERDLVTVRRLAAENGTDDGVIAAWQANSTHRRDWVLRILQRELPGGTPGALVAVWGLAYKKDTHSTKNSPSLDLLRALSPCRIRAHDPVAQIDVNEFPHVARVPTASEAPVGAAALVIMTPWDEYGSIPAESIRSALSGKLVIDPFGVLKRADCARAGLKHFQLGC
jgi:UDPglucose 6-dehydrogenase